MGHSYDGEERRKYTRVTQHYSLLFYLKDSPDKRSDETFTKDISRGGIRFTTSQPIPPGKHLIFEIGIPYMAPKRLIVEGVVITCKEIAREWVYEISAQFNSVDAQVSQIFDMIEKRNIKDQKHGLS